MANLIKGENLTADQRAQVLAAYVNGAPKDDEWIRAHAFYFVKDGSRLSGNHHHCEPAFLADEPNAGESRPLSNERQ